MDQKSRIILCPYCGRTQPPPRERCDACGGWFEPLSLKATHIAMGPWYVRDKQHPFRPGCSFEVLHEQIASGRIKPTTVIRGPTTRQLWSIARNTPGVAHLLGYCHACNDPTPQDALLCPHCGETFPQGHARNELGLLYPTTLAVAEARAGLDNEMAQQQRGSIADGTMESPGTDRPGKNSGRETLEATPPPQATVVSPAGTTPVAAPESRVDARSSHDGSGEMSVDRAGTIGTLAWCLIVFNGLLLVMIIVLLIVWRYF